VLRRKRSRRAVAHLVIRFAQRILFPKRAGPADDGACPESGGAPLVDAVLVQKSRDGGFPIEPALRDADGGEAGGVAERDDLRFGCHRVVGEGRCDDVDQRAREDIGAITHVFENDADREELIFVDHGGFGTFIFPGIEGFQGVTEQLLQGYGSMSFVQVWQEIHHSLSPWRKGVLLRTPD